MAIVTINPFFLGLSLAVKQSLINFFHILLIHMLLVGMNIFGVARFTFGADFRFVRFSVRNLGFVYSALGS